MKLPGVECLETAPKFRKRKKNSSSCVYVLNKMSHEEISCPGRAVAAKKGTKKCNARAELLFWCVDAYNSRLQLWTTHFTINFGYIECIVDVILNLI